MHFCPRTGKITKRTISSFECHKTQVPQLWVCVNALVAHAHIVQSDHARPFIYRTKSPKMSEVNSPKLMTGFDWICPEELWKWILFFFPSLPAFCSNSPEGAVKESFVLRAKWEQRLTNVAIATIVTIIAWSTCKAPRAWAYCHHSLGIPTS